ncbi:MAG: N-acetyltransferase family protein [Arenicellales bacterium]|nr:N-acetyltransferase family protein [Arenicellales bacterium]
MVPAFFLSGRRPTIAGWQRRGRTTGQEMVRVIVRAAVAADLVAIQKIYAREVHQGAASFETSPPGMDLTRQRWQQVRAAGLPYLVAEVDGEIAGFAYALPYRPRPAYRYTVEHSLYVAPSWQRQGVGARLFEVLIDQCVAAGARQMIGIIGDSANVASIRAHEKAGFERAGTLRNVGWKFDRWLDTVIMQRALGRGSSAAADGEA